MKKIMQAALAAFAVLAVALALVPAVAKAAVVESGTWGTCPWELDDTGTLTVHPGTGESVGASMESPWVSVGAQVKSIVFVKEGGQKAIAPENSKYLFKGMEQVKTIDLSGLDTSKATSMAYMFYGCNSLDSLDLTIDTQNVTTMAYMFFGCSSLASLDLSAFDTAKVTDMHAMFSGCIMLGSLNVKSFDTSNVTDMFAMFSQCSSLASIDLSSFDTSKVTRTWLMFSGCSSLATIAVGSGWSMASVRDSSDMFADCTSLVGGNGTVYSADHVDAEYARVDAEGAPGYLTAKAEGIIASGTWGTCPWDLTDDGTLTVHPGVGASQESQFFSPWDSVWQQVKRVVFVEEGGKKAVAPADCSVLFGYLEKVESIDLSGLDTSNVTDMSGMFWNCVELKSISGLSLDTSKVTNMGGMFSGCESLAELDLSSFDTSKVTSMVGMFYACTSLTELDLSGFDTSNVTDMTEMFYSGYKPMSLTTIYVGTGWSTAKVTESEDMFLGCEALVGGNGTVYSADHVDAAYAHVDAAGNPGYLTAKGGQAPVHAPGWAYENGGYYYYENDGTLRKNAWISYAGSWYYLGADGKLVVNGWAPYQGKNYYMGANGKVTFNSWVKYDGKYYYLNGSGNPTIGWARIGGSWYYFNADGTCLTNGWAPYAGKDYYIGADGKVVTNRFVSYDGSWYYLNGSGNAVVNDWVYYGGKYYHLDADGHPETDKWIEYNGVWYHVNASGFVDNSWRAA